MEYVAKYEQICNIIFGSQLEALVHLYKNNSPNDLDYFYKKHIQYTKIYYPTEKPAAFNMWSEFLLQHDLVKNEGPMKFSITDSGKEFIDYASNNQRLKNYRLA